MKAFLSRLFLFLIPVILFIFFIEWVIVNNNPYVNKRDYMLNNQDSVEVLLLGSSHVDRSVNPLYFHKKAAFLAISGSDMNTQIALYEKWHNQFSNLKYVVFEVSAHSLEFYRNRSNSKKAVLKKYFDVDLYQGIRPVTDYLLITSDPKLNLQRFVSFITGKNRFDINEYGFISNRIGRYKKFKYDIDQIENKAWHLEDIDKTLGEQAFNDITLKFSKVIENSLENGLTVILLLTPKYHLYQKSFYPDVFKRRESFLMKYMDTPNLHIWDFEKKYEYDIKLFMDHHHMNADGAEVFTKALDSLFIDLEDN